ncbi:DUF6301 family protein [Nocardia sp. NPDC004711]
MFVESEKVERIAAVAASFDWTWTREDLPAICEALGWGVLRCTEDFALLRTDLMSDRPEAYWSTTAWDTDGVREVLSWGGFESVRRSRRSAAR